MSPLPSRVQTPVAGYSTSSQLISSGMNTRDQDPTYDSSQIQTVWDPYGNRFRVLAACLTCFGNGMNDSAPGALIASIEKSDGYSSNSIQHTDPVYFLGTTVSLMAPCLLFSSAML